MTLKSLDYYAGIIFDVILFFGSFLFLKNAVLALSVPGAYFYFLHFSLMFVFAQMSVFTDYILPYLVNEEDYQGYVGFLRTFLSFICGIAFVCAFLFLLF